jgi:hypothetical protein
MAYDREQIFSQALSIIEKDEDCVFNTDLIASLPISESTFYEYFPASSEYSESIKEKLEVNRTNLKKRLRKIWYKSSSAVTQIALYKLLCLNTPQEAKALTNQSNISIEPMVERPIFKEIDINVRPSK